MKFSSYRNSELCLYCLIQKIIFLVFLSISCIARAQDKHSGCAAKVDDKEWYSSDKRAPLFKGLEGINFPITTKNPESQKYFNQGLMLSYAFNHAEAARSFYEAIRLDSSCAMCYWGYALVLGPNYNAGMESDNIPRAYQAVNKAQELSDKVSQRESLLIMALTRRYDSIQTADRSWNDEMYTFAMGGLYQAFPEDADIGTLYAEAMMNQHPWDLWNRDGSPKPWTPEIIRVLENVLRIHPNHPGANHYYIHAVEASSNPGRASASADLLRDLVPGAGHLVHMPSHIYIRTGRYHEGTLANQKAVETDNEYISSCHAQGVYPLAYFPHNYHFMAATAALEGDRETAVMASRKMRERLDRDLMKDPAWGTLQHYYSILYYVMVKFGMWDEIIREESPGMDLPYPAAVLEYAKGMAALSGKDISTAEIHLKNLKNLMSDTSIRQISVWGLNSASDLLKIALNVLEGECLNKKGDFKAALAKLVTAIETEDQLNYNEPPDWFFSVRHNYAAIALEHKLYSEAEKALREDLTKFPLNGWALSGLKEALKQMGKTREAEEAEKQFEKAWQFSGLKITSPRLL